MSPDLPTLPLRSTLTTWLRGDSSFFILFFRYSFDKMLLALYMHNIKCVFIKLFTFFFISPLYLIPVYSLLISSFFSSLSNFCTCLLSDVFLPSGSLSAVEVRSIQTGQSTCTTTALHLVHWPVVSLIPAASLQRWVLLLSWLSLL